MAPRRPSPPPKSVLKNEEDDDDDDDEGDTSKYDLDADVSWAGFVCILEGVFYIDPSMMDNTAWCSGVWCSYYYLL